MDEELEEQDQYGQEQEKIEKAVEKSVKNVIKETARIAGQIIKKLAKEGFKKLIALIGWKGILIILAVILAIVLIAVLWFGIKNISFNSISTTVSEVIEETEETEQTGNIGSTGKIGQVSKITNVNEDDRNLTIDTEELEERLDKWFEENYVDKELLGVDDDYSTFEKFLEAEAVTSYPDLRTRNEIGTDVPDGELQGCVQFHRYYDDGTSQVLEFMKYDEFSKKLAELGVKLDDNQTQEQIYFDESDVTQKYNELKDKFTLDASNNLIIAGLYSSKTTVTFSDYAKEEGNVDGTGNSYNFNIQVERVNFQNVIQKYSMPFELCLGLLMTTDNPGFCEELVKLAKDSTIIIDVQDNITTTVITDVYSYTANFQIKKFKYYNEIKEVPHYAYLSSDGKPVYETHTEEVESNVNGTWEGSVDASNYRTSVNTIVNNQIQLCVREIDTWIADYKSVYSNDVTTTTEESTYKEDDETEYSKIAEDYHGYGDNVSCEVPEGVTIERESLAVWEKKTDKKTLQTITTTENNYNKTSSDVRETPEKFLSLLKVNPTTKKFDLNNLSNNTQLLKYESIEGMQTSPASNLLSADAILYDLLSSNTKTVTLEDTMRYLIKLYQGKTTLDTVRFTLYEPGDFNSIFAGTSGLTGIQGQIYDFLLSKGMSSIGAAAILGNMEQESSFRLDATNGTHFGLCQWDKDNRWAKLNEHANQTNRSPYDLYVQLEYLWIELEGSYSNVKTQLMNATDLEEAVRCFCEEFERCGNYEVEVPKRLIYAQKWYDLASKSVNHSGVGDIQKYALSVYKGYIEYKQLDYDYVPPSYRATSASAGTIKAKGCMPTSISIILSGLGVKDAYGNAYTPVTLIESGTITNNLSTGNNSTYGNAKNTFNKCGHQVSEVRYTSSSNAKNDILTNLSQGNPILVHAARGEYTSEGHFMTILDVEGDQVYLSNPSSKTNKTGWKNINDLINPSKGHVDWYVVVYK